MSYILSFVNEKGGAGKTSASCNVAAEIASAMKELSADSKPVLLIDADPAGGSTIDIGPDKKPKKYYSDIIMEFCQSGTVSDIREAIVPTDFEGLDIMPANSKLGLATETMRNQEIAREKILSQIFTELHKYYSWIIIDTIGAKHNILTINVLALSIPESHLYVAIPVEPEQKNISSYVNTKNIIHTINSAGINKTDVIAVFFTKIDERRTYDKVMREQGEKLFGKAYLDCPIHYAGAVTRLATEKHMPISYVKPNSRIAKDYQNLCSEIVQRILGGNYDG